VLRWLAAHGVGSSRLSAMGFGMSRPIATDDTEEGRAANRRVEFVIVKGEASPPPRAARIPR
jgi:outer membrane protein OmpA-like peptidoglycan-associated protein